MKRNQLKRLIEKRAKASSITFAVFIMVVVLVVLGSIILLAYLNSRVLVQANYSYVLRSNLNSGINILLADPDFFKDRESMKISLYGEGNDSIWLSRKRWGVFDLYQVKTWWRHLEMQKTFLAGSYHADKDNQVLYLVDQNRPLSICGKTKISGDCLLPVSGIKKTVIDGVSYQGNALIDGNTYASEKQLPSLKDELASLNFDRIVSQYLFLDEVVILDREDWAYDSLVASFYGPVNIVYSPEQINLIDEEYSGHVIILSEKRITVDRDCRLSDIIVCAPSIFIDPGFSGNIQCIARDTLLVGDSCHLKYPSTLILANTQDSDGLPGTQYMKIKSNSIIEGIVISNTKHHPKRKSPVILFEKNTEIHGQLYCSSFLQMQGKLFGTAYVMSFFLKTPSSIYENHLLDAQFSKPGLSKYYTGVELSYEREIKSVIKYLR